MSAQTFSESAGMVMASASPEPDNTNVTPIILGTFFGIFGAIIVGVVVAVFFAKKKKKQAAVQDDI